MADKQFTYYNVKAHKEQVIDMCEGNIQIIIDVLADYGNMMSEQILKEQMDTRARIAWEYRLKRIIEIREHLEQATGYVWEEQREKCRKREMKKPDDIGDDAFNMLAKKR